MRAPIFCGIASRRPYCGALASWSVLKLKPSENRLRRRYLRQNFLTRLWLTGANHDVTGSPQLPAGRSCARPRNEVTESAHRRRD